MIDDYAAEIADKQENPFGESVYIWRFSISRISSSSTEAWRCDVLVYNTEICTLMPGSSVKIYNNKKLHYETIYRICRLFTDLEKISLYLLSWDFFGILRQLQI